MELDQDSLSLPGPQPNNAHPARVLVDRQWRRFPVRRHLKPCKEGPMAWRLGIDTGGTFTDICLFDQETGRVEVWKTPSTPDDPSTAIVQGLTEAMRRIELAAGDIGYFGHGTTVATNALIQQQGTLTGLDTSDGFRDLLEIGRQKRPHLYDLQADKPRALVSRELRLAIPERV